MQSLAFSAHWPTRLPGAASLIGAFLGDLAARGLIEIGGHTLSTVGFFAVAKRDGKQRLIMDTRIANLQFKDPPHTDEAAQVPPSWANDLINAVRGMRGAHAAPPPPTPTGQRPPRPKAKAKA